MKILHLEDDPNDVELVHTLLREEWGDCEVTVVDSQPAYIAALQRGVHDLILSDFKLPGFSGLEALQLARERAPNTPFIFVSGTIGEDRAIEAVHAGAADYVLKDRMKRLTTAIQRALREDRERHRRHRAEAALQESNERFVLVARATNDALWDWNLTSQKLWWNESYEKLYGRPPGEVPADINSWTSFIHPEDLARVHASIRHAIDHGAQTWQEEYRFQRADGSYASVLDRGFILRDAAGKAHRMLGSMLDVTARKTAEALDQGQRLLMEMMVQGASLSSTLEAVVRFVETQAPDTICSILLLDDDGVHLRHGAASASLPAAYLEAIDGSAIGPAGGSCGAAAYRREAVIVRDIATDPLWADYRHLALPHGLRACWSRPIFDPDHRVLGTFAIYFRETQAPTPGQERLLDIATHIASLCLIREQAVKQIHDQTMVINRAPLAIIITDLNHRVTYWNDGAAQIFDRRGDEVLGRTAEECFPAQTLPQWLPARAATLEKGEWHGEIRIEKPDGRRLAMEFIMSLIHDEAGRPKARLCIGVDITEKKSLQEQFFRAQRLESIGMLAAGIAHDLNNVLTPILMAAPMLRRHATDPLDLRLLETLEHSAERGASLVRQILSFAHGTVGDARLLQVKHLARDIVEVIESTFPKSIRFEQYFPSHTWPVRANPTQIHQILLNLCVNARDAMPQGGLLGLRTGNVTMDEAKVAAIPGSRLGSFVVIEVSDTGTGIPPAVLAHIWDPFFTTKGEGKGTGLGLSTVRGIVENHQGFIALETAADRGTTFRIYLPAAEVDAEGPAAGSADPLLPRGNGELILLVDDEANNRDVTQTTLTRHGYSVLVAANGTEAVALFVPRSDELRLVISDFNMPNLDGSALARILQRLKPGLPVLAISGRADRPTGFTGFLAKPFKPDALLRKVHELLHPAAPPA